MIEVHDLTKDFDGFRAVDRINLNVPAGSVLALLGPNGAGKTTSVRMMTSILAPTSGRATIAGFDVVQQPAQVRAHVGVLTEQHGVIHDGYQGDGTLELLLKFVPEGGKAERVAMEVDVRTAVALVRWRMWWIVTPYYISLLCL